MGAFQHQKKVEQFFEQLKLENPQLAQIHFTQSFKKYYFSATMKAKIAELSAKDQIKHLIRSNLEYNHYKHDNFFFLDNLFNSTRSLNPSVIINGDP